MSLFIRRAPLFATLLSSSVCRGFLSLVALGAVSAASSAAQLDTIFIGGNGQVDGAAVFFDLQVTQPVRIDSLAVNSSGAVGGALTLTVFITAPGQSYTTNLTSPAGWTQVATGSGTNAGPQLPSNVDTSDFTLPAGIYGVAIQHNGGGPNYTNGDGTTTPGSGTNQTYTSGPLTLRAGAAMAAPFTNGIINQPRVFNGSIFFTLIGGNGACCRPNGTCVVQDLATCAAPNIGQNPGSTCSGAGGGCPVATVACCNNTTFACSFITGTCPTNATTVGAVCTPSPCTGACCAPSGACAVGALSSCVSPSLPQSFGSTCAAGACPQATFACCSFVGACVFANGSCPSGTTQGGTVCSPSPCSTQPSICQGLETTPLGALPPGWTSTVPTGVGAPWAVVNSAAHTGAQSVFTNDVGTTSEQVLELSPVTAAGTLTLDIWTNFTTEQNWDGWVVEFSTDGGGSWTDVGISGWVLNGYNVAALNASANPLQTRPAFSGAQPTWTERACTIPASVGQQVSVRFRMGSDASVAGTGVWIDDICFYNIQTGSGACCASSGSCAVSSNTTCTGLFRGVGVACASGNACPAPFGKCCNNSTGACTLTAGSASCSGVNTYGGDGTTCSTACASVSTCCNPATAACTAIFGGSCPAGMDLGNGATCGPNACQYGACCGGCAGCTITPAASCSGSYAGNSTTCAANCVNDGYTVAPSPTTIAFIPAIDDIGNHCDDCATNVSLPFNVNFYGVSNGNISVTSNGFIQFTTAVAPFTNACLPSNVILGPALLPYWDDQRTDIVGGAGIFTTTTGSAPNRTFVIEFRTYYFAGPAPAAPDLNYEVLLYEGQNFFDVVYGSSFTDLGSATIGVQSNGTAASPSTQFECNVATATANSSIRFNCGVGVANGACCNNTAGTCSSVTQGNCPAGSTFQGVGTLCNPNPCPQPPSGVCCRGSTCNTTVTTAAACSGSLVPGQTAGARFVSNAPACNGGSNTSPCCYADFNKVGGISVQDIFDFLNDWFASSPYARTGGNGAPATLAVQNIFDFLNAWFAGGC